MLAAMTAKIAVPGTFTVNVSGEQFGVLTGHSPGPPMLA
jgi:hypothetical protein